MRTTGILILGAVLLLPFVSLSTPQAAPRSPAAPSRAVEPQPVARVYVKPVRCQYKDCWECSTPDDKGNWQRSDKVGHGELHIVYADGRDVKVKTTAPVTGDSNYTGTVKANAPQIAPDNHTVGWTQGEHKANTDWSIKGTMYVNSKLAIYRNGRIMHLLSAPGTFIEGWRFVNGARQVSVYSRWHHGMGYMRLFDVNSGKLLIRMDENEARQKEVPWARGVLF